MPALPNNPRPRAIPPEIILANEVKQLTRHVQRMTSMRYRFLYGIIEGFGGVIGATLIVSLVLFLLTQLEQVRFMKPFVEALLRLVGQ